MNIGSIGRENNFPQTNDISNNTVVQGDPVISSGIAVLYLMMDTLSDLATQKFSQMEQKSEFCKQAQDMANQVDEVIAEASKGDDKTTKPLPDSVVNYMRDNNIKIDGMDIDSYLKKHGPNLDKGRLQAVKAVLESESNRASDFVSQSQLKIQKILQTNQVTVTMINSMQSMLSEMNKSIAQNIR